MKKLVFLFILISVLSCDNTLNLNADWKDIPIVYALLSASQENQYIRIEKAFLDPVRPATEVALIPDSIYYSNLNVSLFDISNQQSYPLVEIDGADEGFPRNSGAFAQLPNTLYKLSGDQKQIKPGEKYELQIQRSDNTSLITAQTTIIDTLLISLPGARINMNYTDNFRIQWFPKTTGNDPASYDISMQINFREIDVQLTDPEWQDKSLIWEIKKDIDNTELLTLGLSFFNFIAENLTKDINIKRSLVSLDIIVDAGGQEILDYGRIGTANLGITASQEIPFYTNISEGRGIFSSRNRKVKSRVLLTEQTQELLSSGELTADLNFGN